MIHLKRKKTMLLFALAIQLASSVGTAVFSGTVVKPTVREGDPRCKHEGAILFCDYRGTTEVVEMGYYLGTSIQKVDIRNAKKVLLNFPVCVNIKFQNVSKVYVTDSKGKHCKSSTNLSAFGTELDRVPRHINKIYLEDSVIDVLKTNSSLRKLIILNSKIRTLDISKPLFEGTNAVLQGSFVSSFYGNIISKNSSMIIHKTTIDKILDRDFVVHSGGRITLDNSTIQNISKGGVFLAPEAQIVIENFLGRIEINGLLLTETQNQSNGRADMASTVAVSETSVSMCECLSGHGYKEGLIILAVLFSLSFILNSFLVFLIVKKNSLIKDIKGRALKDTQEQENLLKNDCVDGLASQTAEGDRVSSDDRTTCSYPKTEKDEIEESRNSSQIEESIEESKRKTKLVMEKLNKIQNKIQKAENYIMEEKGESTNLENPCDHSHTSFDNIYDKRIETLERQERACEYLLKGQASAVTTDRLKRISEIKTMIVKAKVSTRSYLEKRAKLMAIRRESHYYEKTNRYEAMSHDALDLLQETASSLVTLGLHWRVDLFFMYVNRKFGYLIELCKHDYDEHRKIDTKTCSDRELLPQSGECESWYDKPFPNEEFETEMNSKIQNLPDLVNISDGHIERNLDLLLSTINKNIDIIQPTICHENEIFQHKKKYLIEIDSNLSTVLTFLRSTLSIIIKILTIDITEIESMD